MADKYKVTCPECGQIREVKGKSYYTAIMRGRESSRCKSCGATAGINKRLIAIALKRKGENVKSCGCTLTIAAPKYVGGCEMASRCERWDACGNKSACLKAIGMHNWSGFTADCAGFVQRQFDRLMPMSDVRI